MSELETDDTCKPIQTFASIYPEEEPPTLPTFSDDGIDLTVIRWMLSLTPIERLRTAQRYAASVRRLQNALRKL